MCSRPWYFITLIRPLLTKKTPLSRSGCQLQPTPVFPADLYSALVIGSRIRGGDADAADTVRRIAIISNIQCVSV